MNYQKLYDNLIESRRANGIPVGYKEIHHILPISFGGTNEKTNLIALTAREHFIAYRLLAKIYPNTGMVHAVYKMACSNLTMKRYNVTSRLYEYLRVAHAQRVSIDEVAKAKRSKTLKGRKQTPEHVKARTKSRLENGESWLNENSKKKIGEGNKGKIGPWRDKSLPKEMVEKRNESRRRNGNYAWTDKQKQKRSEMLTGKPGRPVTDEMKKQLSVEKSKKITCPHCGKEGQMMVMPRWHFDNCRQKLS